MAVTLDAKTAEPAAGKGMGTVDKDKEGRGIKARLGERENGALKSPFARYLLVAGLALAGCQGNNAPDHQQDGKEDAGETDTGDTETGTAASLDSDVDGDSDLDTDTDSDTDTATSDLDTDSDSDTDKDTDTGPYAGCGKIVATGETSIREMIYEDQPIKVGGYMFEYLPPPNGDGSIQLKVTCNKKIVFNSLTVKLGKTFHEVEPDHRRIMFVLSLATATEAMIYIRVE